MASTIAAAGANTLLNINWLGAYGETAKNVIGLGTIVDADIQQFIDDMDAVSRAGMPKVTLALQRAITGQATTPVAESPDSKVNDMLVLVFTQPHPLNSALTITKSVQLRAPTGAVIGTNGALVVASAVGDRSSADESLRGVIDYLEDHLTYEAVDGSLTIGGWTWDSGASAYVSGPSVIDGQ